MKFSDARNDLERLEVLRREIRRIARHHPEIDDLQTLRLDVGTEPCLLPGDTFNGEVITRSALDVLIEEVGAKVRAESRLESRVRDLIADANAARDAALEKIRNDFHARWGFFYKCLACGGRVEPGARDRYGPLEPGALCPCGSRTFRSTGYSR